MPRRFLHALLLGAILQAGIPSALAEAALRIRMGDSSYGKAVLTVVGSKVRLGDSTYTSTIFLRLTATRCAREIRAMAQCWSRWGPTDGCVAATAATGR